MSNPETPVLQIIRLEVGGRPDTRLYRNNCGVLLDREGRPVRFGLCPGSSDLIGWRTVTVTREMVGSKLAVFLAIEVKTATGSLTAAQSNFLRAVALGGGLSGIARSAVEAHGIVDAL